MAKKNKGKPRSENKTDVKTKIFIKTQIFALIVYLIIFAVTSVAVYSSNIDKSKSFYLSAAAFAVASFICGFYSGYKIHKNGMYVGLLFGLPMNIIIILVSFIVNSFKVDLTALITLVILIICSMLGGVLSVNTKLRAK